MAEYVTEWGESVADFTVREEVVRCRDCKHYTPEYGYDEDRGFGLVEHMWEPGGCFNPLRCSTAWDNLKGEMVPVGIVTEPDGFCAWGKRKESE